MTYDITRYLAMQYRELEEHKYYLSEKAGKEISWNITLKDWANTLYNGVTHAERFSNTYHSHIDSIDKVCESHCNNECKGLDSCVLRNYEIHELLEDD